MTSSTKQALWVVGGLAGFVAVMVALNYKPDDGIVIRPAPAAAQRAPAPVPVPAEPSRVANADEQLEVCRAKLKIAADTGILHNMTFDDGRPKVWIGPTWYSMSIEQKTGLAETAACFFLAGNVGDGGRAITFPIYDGRSGKEIATWKFTRLEVE
jgi:hypothetical protein